MEYLIFSLFFITKNNTITKATAEANKRPNLNPPDISFSSYCTKIIDKHTASMKYIDLKGFLKYETPVSLSFIVT